MHSSTKIEMPDVPWWRVNMVWLVIAGPLAVVAASIATSVIAWRGADEVVTERHVMPRHNGKSLSAAPAVQARNETAAAD